MLKKLIFFITNNFIIDRNSKLFVNFLKQKWNKKHCPDNGTILVELYSPSFTIVGFSYFVNILASEKKMTVKSFCLSQRNYFLCWLKNRRIFHIYTGMGAQSHVHFSYKVNRKTLNEVNILLDKLMPTLRSKEDVVNLEIEGLKIGVDLYEYYLYQWKKPTLEIDDPKFKDSFKNILTLIFYWKEYFENNNIKYLILSHALYDYGVLYKLATQFGIKTFLPSVRSMVQLTNQDHFLCPEFENYRNIFSKLNEEDKKSGIEIAKNKLSERLSGKIGVNIPYSKLSAFSVGNFEKRVLKSSNKLKILIATHCFFDNPWAYGKNIFIDFYEWINYLGKMSNETDYEWYLKTHPDSFPENDIFLDELLQKYPKIIKISSKISHHQLVNEGISWVFTVYGTIGHEYPLLGVNVLNAGRKNPHIAYDFNWHTKDLEEYEFFIRNLPTLKKEINRDEIYEFYYVNYYCLYNDTLILKSYYDMASKVNLDEFWSSKHYKYFLDEVTQEKHTEIIENIKYFINSNDFWYIASLK